MNSLVLGFDQTQARRFNGVIPMLFLQRLPRLFWPYIQKMEVVYVERKIRRGDMFYADLTPCVGSEQSGFRPILIIQNDLGNKHSRTVIAAVITSKTAGQA
jgi:hypothetical protein